ncbi:MAG: Hpt domain-containing protein [Scytonema sp. PMC 1070.18]|nr:Hpt domain-containing protein [Scytonema sp. PMC 1070.18]
MLSDKQLETKVQFLEETTLYLNSLEAVLYEVKLNSRISQQSISAGLKAVHSIKGGASIMGFRILSDLAQRLENALQSVKNQKKYLENDSDLHSLLLSGVEWLCQIIKLYLKGYTVDEQWLATFCYPVFQELQEHCGYQFPEEQVSPQIQNSRLQDIISLLFQTEVEDYLRRLESLIANVERSVLKDEVTAIALELRDLGKMLQLQAFTQLCESIAQQLETADRVEEIASLALQAWRRSQALVISQINTYAALTNT